MVRNWIARGCVVAAACLPLVSATGRLGAAQTDTPQTARPLLIDSLTGSDTFANYCAACHGSDARGGGPVASSLRTTPPDLTGLSARNGGAFPREQVRAAVLNTDRPITAHGTGEMPVWGAIFRALDPNDRRVAVRIDNVVAYLETLQAPAAAPTRDGRALFTTYCATCHGPNGRGGGVMAPELRHVVPDLTKFAARNGGVFPSMKVRQIIDGTGVPGHGTREMPVWGDAFARQLGRDEAAARIDALTDYLASIQERQG